VIAAYLSLLVLVGLTPVLIFFDVVLIDGLVGLYAAIAILLLAFSLRTGEARHWISTIRWATLLALLPVLWIIIQLLPLRVGGLSQSIWQSAATALGTRLWESITIDPGLTILALERYVSLIAIGAIAAAVSIERQRAERLFIVLTVSAAIASVVSLASHWLGFLQSAEFGAVRDAAALASSAGVVLSAAMMILVVEHHLTRRAQQDFRLDFLAPLLAATVSLLLCASSAALMGSGPAIFAAACGVTGILLIQIVRRVGLGWRSAMITACVAIFAGAVIVSSKATPVPGHIAVRYATNPAPDLVSVTDRMIGETGLAGSGAGTFSAIFRIFASGDVAGAYANPPTSAARIAVEFGQASLWIMLGSIMALIILCARGGFDRGRDFYYPLAGAGCGVTALVSAFCNSGMDNTAVAILLASTLGLALAQSASRSRHTG
jgi:hypothetical protein